LQKRHPSPLPSAPNPALYPTERVWVMIYTLVKVEIAWPPATQPAHRNTNWKLFWFEPFFFFRGRIFAHDFIGRKTQSIRLSFSAEAVLLLRIAFSNRRS
jgi:hypothetical protein